MVMTMILVENLTTVFGLVIGRIYRHQYESHYHIDHLGL